MEIDRTACPSLFASFRPIGPHADPFASRHGRPLMVVCVLAILLLIGCEQRSSQPAGAKGVSGSADESIPLAAQESKTQPGIVRWVKVDGLPREIAIMDSVFWEPDDTISLRERIRTTPEIKGATVLEIGTGSGLVSLCCLQSGAATAVATDLNPSAVANARENAKLLGLGDRLNVREVPRRDPAAWTVIAPDETFDFIISNPPWENQKPVNVEQFALYDPDFRLLDSLVQGARKKLRPNGRMWLAYGCVTAICRIQEVAAKEELECRLLDDRSLDTLPEVFLPGMLIEITVPAGTK
ncbi:MAG: 50S ribosomal protein L11 methyltransferase [Planctomycetaceae bacterium]|nr:50S ribosomal protein L11 methyltransferase [Planctomycetaceae bacterium]